MGKFLNITGVAISILSIVFLIISFITLDYSAFKDVDSKVFTVADSASILSVKTILIAEITNIILSIIGVGIGGFLLALNKIINNQEDAAYYNQRKQNSI